MKFERHKDPMEGMNIGRIGNPVLIYGLFSAETIYEESSFIATTKVNMMSDKDSRRILEGIERKEISFWEKRYLCGVVKFKNYSMTKYLEEPLEDYKGQYVLFQRKKYLIPE